MKSFDYHCIHDTDSRDDRWNFIDVKYTDNTESTALTVRFSPDDALFNDDIAEPIDIESEYLIVNAHYYKVEEFHTVLVSDQSGLDVVVTSNISLIDIISYMELLIPIGNFGNVNPWEACE